MQKMNVDFHRAVISGVSVMEQHMMTEQHIK